MRSVWAEPTPRRVPKTTPEGGHSDGNELGGFDRRGPVLALVESDGVGTRQIGKDLPNKQLVDGGGFRSEPGLGWVSDNSDPTLTCSFCFVVRSERPQGCSKDRSGGGTPDTREAKSSSVRALLMRGTEKDLSN